MDYFVNLFGEIQKEKENYKNIMLISTDITKAFDNVNKKILIEILNKIDTPKPIVNWIYQFLTNRTITYNNGTNTIKQVTNKGIPQGSCLSPCLFNLYTHEIHKLEQRGVSVFQFADDIVILIKGKNEEEAKNRANNTLGKLNEELSKLELKLNPNKCKYIRLYKNKPSNAIIKINDVRLKEEKILKILGVTFNNKLSLAPHYKNLDKEITKATNLLKKITHRNGGAHPYTMLNIYKAIIQTKTKFADIITPTNIKNNIKIKQKIINQNIRICSGMLKTTPIPMLLAETGTLPAELDNKLTTLKYITNQIHKNSPTGEKIQNNNTTEKLRILFNQNNFLTKIEKNKDKSIRTTENIIINEDIESMKEKINTNQIETMSHYIETLNKYKGYQEIYTDGSLKNNKGGIGLYFKHSNINMKIRLENHATIKTIETIAIKMAIKEAIVAGITNILILTDSKSSCLSIKKVNKNKNYKAHEKEIIDLATNNNNIKIIIQWIPAHIGISGNEIADKLAKEAVEEPDKIVNNLITIEDAHQLISEIIRNEWEQLHNRWTTRIGKYNKLINNTPPRKPWFAKSNLNAYNIRQINRIRADHAKNKKFKKMVGLETDNLCETCNETEDNEHIFEKCRKYNSIRDKYPLIKNYKLIDILKTENTGNYNILCNYLKEIEYEL